MSDIGSNTYTRGRLYLNSSATSRIDRRYDRDWFRIYLNAGQRVRFDLEGSPTGRGSLSDTYLRGIYDSSGDLAGDDLADVSDDDGGTSTNSRVTFTASSSGYYYVAAGAFGSNTGTYRLTATALGIIPPPSPSDDYSASTGTRGRLNLNGSTTGNIERSGDRDWFRIRLNAGQRVRFDLEGSPTSRGTLSDTYLRGIYDSSGDLAGDDLADVSDDDGGTSTNSRVTFTASSPGYYYVAAGAYGSNTGTYRLMATALGIIPPPSPSDDYSTSTGTRGRLNLNGSTTGNIERSGDRDWFRIRLNAGQRVRFDLEGRPTSRGTLSDTYLRGIYNSSGNQLSGTTDDDGGLGRNSRVTFTASQTRYYYVAAGAYSGTGTYRLTATALVSDTTAPLLLGSSPNDDATNVLPGADIRLTFNEAVSRGSGNIIISNLTSGGSRTIGVGDSRVRFSGNTVTIDPGGDLTAGQMMQVTFGSGVVKDLAGNNFSGLSAGSLNFTTERRTGLTSQQSTLLSTLRSEFDQEITRITYDANVNDANLYPTGTDNARDYNGQCVSYVKIARTNLNFT
uniref:Pre-peptidase C-terminal domain-containing protein n=1 Tax=Candidatus Kentrum sp. UNK TaxID=2126344 RepID=A0A451ACC9_9GAMM|nr:MAG: pre-peptidase C-terminal domain-containing protein [Candidatus Kentron sp. UNK]VFK70893.1 MAG: pre-peptidase C-terminal domain-containing protein [Candidatus Kentron sp. UNK]